MKVGIVVIGRNEAANLTRTFAALPTGCVAVYVDSASEDASVAIAEEAGIEVLKLSSPPRLTAGRGRNAGIERLINRAPDIQAVQTLDGDCELSPGWLKRAEGVLEANPDAAAICGQLRERDTKASLYNRLCQREWRIPAGDIASCGGNALFRIAAFQAVGGFDPAIPAGEEPDLCFRLRAQNWRIVALDQQMAVHDADLSRFSQWWSRASRGGSAFADLFMRHGRNSDPSWRRQLLSIVGWTSLVPITVVLSAIFSWWLTAAVVVIFGMQTARMAIREWLNGETVRHAVEIAAMTMLGKFAQAEGVLRYLLLRRQKDSGWVPNGSGA